MIKFCKHSKCLSFGLVFSPRNDFCSFKKQKLIELVTSFNDFDIDSYILPNNDPHNVSFYILLVSLKLFLLLRVNT